MSDLNKERLLKLLAMRDRGFGGEAENAELLLNKLLKKNGLTESDLTDGDFCKSPRTFKFSAKIERRLLVQIVSAVVDQWDGSTFCRKNRPKEIVFELTDPQFAEVTVLFSLYRDALYKTLDRAYRAFVQANNIFNPNGKESAADLSDETIKMCLMAQGVAVVKRPRALLGVSA